MQDVIFYGEEKLKQETGKKYLPTVKKITTNVYSLQYFGASNATLIIGETSCILVDAFETDWYSQQARKEIEKITKKPVTTIIYTHMHSDHMGGAIVFSDTVKEVIAHTNNGTILGKQELLAEEQKRRLVHQAGMMLSVEESISMGLGPAVESKGKIMPLPVTKLISNNVEYLEIDGVEIHLIAAPGETDEQQYVWLSKDRIVCSGDNYYASWPNLSALRGGTYRDVNQWIDSLKKLVSLNAEYLIPGHGEILIGADKVNSVLTTYHDAIQWVFEKTMEGINNGLTPDELVDMIRLPEKWEKTSFLQEYYGTVAWSIRGIYAGYMGWFDGNPTHISTLTKTKRAEKYLELLGGAQVVMQEIELALLKNKQEEMQWAMELCDLLLDANTYVGQAKQWKAEACIFLGRMQVSANGRHYYLSYAKRLEKES